jgi:hypothetical protein
VSGKKVLERRILDLKKFTEEYIIIMVEMGIPINVVAKKYIDGLSDMLVEYMKNKNIKLY